MIYKKRSRDGRLLKENICLPSTAEVDIFISSLLEWFGSNYRDYFWRKKSVTLYQRIIAEILLQRTKANTVAIHFPKFIARFPTWKEISSATREELQQFLYPFGLWKQKTKSMKDLANVMVLREGNLPIDYDEIRDLPGIGQYLANAIALFNLNEPRPLIDINMARVLERFFGPRKLTDIRDDPYIQDLAHIIVWKSNNYVDMNFAILDFAALICTKKPHCSQCLIKDKCKYWVLENHYQIN